MTFRTYNVVDVRPTNYLFDDTKRGITHSQNTLKYSVKGHICIVERKIKGPEFRCS